MLRRAALLASHVQRPCRVFRTSSLSCRRSAKGAAMPESVATPAEVGQLEPTEVMSRFAELTQIPRPSKEEARVLSFLKAFSEARGLSCAQDAKGNLVIRKPGANGGESAPTIILQGHVDMVTEKNKGTDFNFSTDPLALRLDEGWLKACGTTLGADNGVGVAAILALLDSSLVKHPPLEALFTVEEEIGLNGASDLDASLLTGKTLINLDSEDWGTIYIGCAGAGDCTLHVDMESEHVAGGADWAVAELRVAGLQGGHSGLQIAQGLGNAVQLLTHSLMAVQRAARGVRIASLWAGDKRNAIPREGAAKLLVPRDELAAAHACILDLEADAQQELGRVEPGLSIRLDEKLDGDVAANPVLCETDTARLLSLLAVLPHGPVRMSDAVPGLVETSNNLAAVKLASDASATSVITYDIVTSTRSSLPSALEASRDRIEAASRLAGARLTRGTAYSGWAPDPDSAILQLTRRAVAAELGRDPEVTAIHAGLECGILGEKLPGVQMISYGPTILGAHSPDERLELKTVRPFWKATLRLMAALAEQR